MPSGRIPQEIPNRFWSKVTLKANLYLCWEWNASKDTGGYGIFSVNGVAQGAHRVAYLLVNETIPEGMHVLHTCDNRSCVNPNHLFLGTNHDNVMDKVAKGRQGRPKGNLSGAHTHPEKILKGSSLGTSKLTESDVIKIRELYANGNTSTYKLAEQYKVSQALIWYAVKKVTWKHI